MSVRLEAIQLAKVCRKIPVILSGPQVEDLDTTFTPISNFKTLAFVTTIIMSTTSSFVIEVLVRLTFAQSSSVNENRFRKSVQHIIIGFRYIYMGVFLALWQWFSRWSNKLIISKKKTLYFR